jgi:hypothetical protein
MFSAQLQDDEAGKAHLQALPTGSGVAEAKARTQ